MTLRDQSHPDLLYHTAGHLAVVHRHLQPLEKYYNKNVSIFGSVYILSVYIFIYCAQEYRLKMKRKIIPYDKTN